jgi:hypothetical protein
MQKIPRELKPAQDEVQRRAHEQDLFEIRKRALLDREAEKGKYLKKPQGAVQVGIENL